jgi:hypothetical protein
MLATLIRAIGQLWARLNYLPPSPRAPAYVPVPGSPAAARPTVPPANELEGLPLRYLIDTDIYGTGRDGEIVEVSYDATGKPARGISVKYCNLFDEKNTGAYGPYLKPSDTAQEYNEGQIDPKGPGWVKNLTEQFARAVAQGFHYVELDNPDAYTAADVLGAIGLAQHYGLAVLAKNPLACSWDATAYVAHPAVVGVIVERGAGNPSDMDALRKKVAKPDLPVWFVAFVSKKEDGRAWAVSTARLAAAFKNMWCTFSPDGEYTSSQDVPSLVPSAPPPSVTSKPAQIIPEITPSNSSLLSSQAAIELIVAEEVGSKAEYKPGPEWPGGGSGVTIGIGYDVGAGTLSKAQLHADWGGHIPDAMIVALEPCIGVTGSRASSLLSSVRNKVSVPWDAAMAVFEQVDVPRWYKICADRLPNFEMLSPDCKGALVSLAYNRGPSFDQAGDRFTEMRAIKAHVAAKEFGKIPQEFRAMERLWRGQGLNGLLTRREHEAVLFEKGLAASVAQSAPQTPPAAKPVVQTAAQSLLDPDQIVGWMQAHNCTVETAPKRVNLVYLEGVNPDGSRNDNRIDLWNDIRLILQYVDGKPRVTFKCIATTEPGTYYDKTHVIGGPQGAALIAPGQQACWQVGIHDAVKSYGHEALVQTGAEVSVYRDFDKSFRRQAGHITTGWYGINQHSTGMADASLSSIQAWSAGCLVVPHMGDHKEWIRILKTDERYLADHKFVFPTTVIPVAWQT